jgi:GNAT superfamily N-acetyltransferase
MQADEFPNGLIRPAKPSDREAIVDVYLAVHTELYAPPSLDILKYVAESRARSLQGAWRSDGYYVAEVEGRIIGFVQVTYDWVRALYVTKDMQSRGVGAALIAKAEQHLRAKGVGLARVAVASAREEIVSFYSRYGWSAGQDLGKDKLWEIALVEMNKTLCERSWLVRVVPWESFKLVLAAISFAGLAAFGVILHDFAGMPPDLAGPFVVVSVLLIGIALVRVRRLNLSLKRCCILGAATVASYTVTLMLGGALGWLALRAVDIERLEQGGPEYVGPVLMILILIALTAVAGHRLAVPLYARLL